jgi:hypothetical protein
MMAKFIFDVHLVAVYVKMMRPDGLGQQTHKFVMRDPHLFFDGCLFSIHEKADCINRQRQVAKSPNGHPLQASSCRGLQEQYRRH